MNISKSLNLKGTKEIPLKREEGDWPKKKTKHVCWCLGICTVAHRECILQ